MAEWRKLKWGDIATLEYGKGLQGYLRDDGKFPVYGTNGRIGTTDSFVCPFPSIVIGRKGAYRGVHYSDRPFYVIDTAFYLNPKVDDFDMKFAFYQLLTVDINGMDSGSAIPSTTREDFYDIDILYPPLSEQRAIASVLSSLDDKIDLLHRQNKTLEALAETLFRQWFVEQAEDGAESIRVSDVAEINSRTISKDYPYTEIEYLDTGSITTGTISTYQIHSIADAPSRAQRIVKDNDIVYSLVRPIQRHYGLLHGVKSNTIASTGFCVITSRGISPHFLYLLLTRDETVDYFDMIAEASTSAYPSLKPSDIADFEFLKPRKDKLDDFSNYASDAWAKMQANQTQIRTLTQLRDTLLPKLMSGEVRVKLA